MKEERGRRSEGGGEGEGSPDLLQVPTQSQLPPQSVELVLSVTYHPVGAGNSMCWCSIHTYTPVPLCLVVSSGHWWSQIVTSGHWRSLVVTDSH